MVNHSLFRFWLRTTLYLALVTSLSGCETWEQDLENKKIEVLVETYFLPDPTRTTVEGSFRLCNTENPRALHWIQSLYNASSNQEVLQVFQSFQDSFNISMASPSWEDFETTHNKVKELATPQSNSKVVNRHAAFLLSAFLHRFYLRNAGTLRQSLRYLEPIYRRTMEGYIPDCVAKGKSTWHPAVYPKAWIILGAIGILSLFVSFRFLFKKPPQRVAKKSKSEEKPVEPKKNNPVASGPPDRPVLRKLYAGFPNGNLLFRLSHKFEPKITCFIIEINPIDKNIGILSLIEDKATLLHAFSMIDALKDACELRSTGAPASPNQITKNVPGEVVLKEGRWEITKKILLEWSTPILVAPQVKETKLKAPTPEKPPAQSKEMIEPPLTKVEITEKPPENQKMPPEIKVVPPPAEPETKVKPPQEPKLVYARMPSGETFSHLYESFQPNETFFILSISPDDPRTASISLTDDLETLEYFLTRERHHQNVCEFLGVGNPTAENVREVEPGSAKLSSNDHWIWKTSIKLDW